MTGPYFLWASATTRLRLPASSLNVSHLDVNLASGGPGISLSGDRKTL